MINAALKEEGAMNIKQMANKLTQMDKETLSKTVRKMLDSGKLSMDQDFLISCCNSK